MFRPMNLNDRQRHRQKQKNSDLEPRLAAQGLRRRCREASPAAMPPPSPERQSSGLPMAFAAYVIWGLLPLYLHFVHQVPPFEFAGWRIIFTVPLCLLFIAL